MTNRPCLTLPALMLALCFGVTTACSQSELRPEFSSSAAGVTLEPDASEVERLRALGYVDVVEDASPERPSGVTIRDAARMQPGLTFFTNALGCSAQLIDEAGTLLQSWELQPCHRWGNALLLPSGEVLVVHRPPSETLGAEDVLRARELVRLSWEGEILSRWKVYTHHDADLRPDGRLTTLAYEHALLPMVHPTVPAREQYVAVLDDQGGVEEQASLTDLLLSDPEVFQLAPVRPRAKDGAQEVDHIHSNSLEWMRDPELAERDRIYAIGNVMVCLRNQDTVAIFDWERRKIVWSWGSGVLSAPHDATLLDNGNILIFDNGVGRNWSRVVEVDPIARQVVWEYHAAEKEDFYSVTRGAAQRLANGNTLITESGRGRLFEVTPEGDIVWEYLNPKRSEDGLPLVVVRARRVSAEGLAERRFERSD